MQNYIGVDRQRHRTEDEKRIARRTQRAAAYGKAVWSRRSLLVTAGALCHATGSKTAIKPAASGPMRVAKCKITATQYPDVARLMRSTGHNI